jgi:hypothetical protein
MATSETTITLRSHERVFLCGRTGSGKTFAAYHILKPLPRLIVLDPKGTLGTWGLRPWDREARRLLKRGEPVRARVTVEFGTDPSEIWQQAYQEIYAAGNATMYIDEVYGVVDPGSKASPELTGLITRGRELRIGVFGCSQRPSWVPLFLMTEAQHFFMFSLHLMEDKRRMAEFMGPEVMEPIRDEHGVYYSYATWERPLYIERLPFSGNGLAKGLDK